MKPESSGRVLSFRELNWLFPTRIFLSLLSLGAGEIVLEMSENEWAEKDMERPRVDSFGAGVDRHICPHR